MGNKHIIEGVATLTGTIIGAGVLGMPYIIAKAGFLTGAITLLALGIMVIFMYLYLGEIVLRTKGNHQLTGYAEIYLGGWGKKLMFLTMLVGIYGALAAYLIGSSEILSKFLGGAQGNWLMAYFLIIASIIYFGLKWVEKCEVFLGIFLFIIILLITFTAMGHVEISNLSEFSISRLFMPYGVILFAYLGMAAIPEMKEEMASNLKDMKKAVVIGATIPIAIYFLFSLAVVGSVGLEKFNSLDANDRIATIALSSIVGEKIFLVGNLFAVLAMTTSFLVLGVALKEMFIFDYRLSHNKAWILTMAIPLIIVMLGFTNFIEALSLTGIFAGGIEGILIVLMALNAKKLGNRKPEYAIPINLPAAIILILVFVAGAVFYFVPI